MSQLARAGATPPGWPAPPPAWLTPAHWGPLAVMHMNGGMDALNNGVLRITGRCVVLERLRR